MRRTITYIAITLAVSTGLYFQQRNIDNKFCNVTTQTRELRRVGTLDRIRQAELFRDYSIVPEIRAYHQSIVLKYQKRLDTDPDLQEPINCEVHKK